MSWESTGLYYQLINQGIKQRLGGLHSAKIAMVSVDFQEIEALQHSGQWEQAGDRLTQAAQGIEAAGADFLLICTNTMHKVAPQIERGIGIPILHIADATAERVRQAGLTTVGLLGTRFTMEQDFYKGRFGGYGISVVVPSEGDGDLVHRAIYDELCLGVVRDESRQGYLRVIEALRQAGAEGVIAGCTEIGTLVQQQHVEVPLLDTTVIHAEAAIAMALG